MTSHWNECTVNVPKAGRVPIAAHGHENYVYLHKYVQFSLSEYYPSRK